MKVSGEVWIQDDSTKDVFCINGQDLTPDPHHKQGNTQDHSYSYNTGDWSIEYTVEERDNSVNYTSVPDTNNCTVIKDTVRFSIEN